MRYCEEECNTQAYKKYACCMVHEAETAYLYVRGVKVEIKVQFK